MRLRRISWMLVLSTIVVGQVTSERSSDTTDLSATEAETLLYLTPAAKEVRKTGLDVFFEPATSDKFNQSDYYVFQMLSTRLCQACSAHVGDFAVNRHTADVRYFDPKETYPLVKGRELAGVQGIVRNAHHITSEVVSHYRDRAIWASMSN